MKNWFRNSAMPRAIAKKVPRSGDGIVNPGDKQVMTIAELVAMTARGQDINVYERPVMSGMETDDLDEGLSMFDANEFMKMDFSEQKEVIDDHRQVVDRLKADLNEKTAKLSKKISDNSDEDLRTSELHGSEGNEEDSVNEGASGPQREARLSPRKSDLATGKPRRRGASIEERSEAE